MLEEFGKNEDIVAGVQNGGIIEEMESTLLDVHLGAVHCILVLVIPSFHSLPTPGKPLRLQHGPPLVVFHGEKSSEVRCGTG